jgi:DNA mismatch endonuclease (patch repair protein)
MDHLDAPGRSANMAKVRGKDTGPEMVVRRLAHSLGMRFRLHRKDLPGRPDLIFPRRRLAVFVHGCFWHRHEGCKRATMPATRADFWADKFAKTVERDARQIAHLEQDGWRVMVVWECELKEAETLKGRLRNFQGLDPARPQAASTTASPRTDSSLS